MSHFFMQNCLIFYAKLSHFLCKIVSFFMQNCLIFYAKLSHFLCKIVSFFTQNCLIFYANTCIVFLSIDLTISSITFLPESFSKSMIIDVLLVLIYFFNIPKNNSTGASSGEYCGKNTPVKFDSLKWLWTFSDRWIEELSMIMQIFSLFRPIVCCKQLACDLSIQRMI